MEFGLHHHATAPSTHVLGPQAFGVPETSLKGPGEVLASPVLTRHEKRSILAFWASDVCTVEGMPAWRCLPRTGALVLLDDILSALHALDRGGSN
jgi:hypothetical protein